MQIATYYKESYDNIGKYIHVPETLQNQPVEVHFIPKIQMILPQQSEQSSLKNLLLSWDTLPDDLHDAFEFDDLPVDDKAIF
ncbi:hypothetical protein ACGTJS_07635 [Faucicola mancuniensis]|uniref:hypothetical protein n=1 Tax=Faucicola mancuniensis TaxID=1309795 RepID=UPI0028E6C3E3|nr:hypothetical protein [uncultured Moraxella sp.]